MRLAQTQVWPAFRYFEAMPPLGAISTSASVSDYHRLVILYQFLGAF
jgi:hypothetical protein